MVVRRIRPCQIIVMALGAFVLAGCGSDELGTVPAGGTVLFKGKPLSTGEIRFVPVDTKQGRMAGGSIEDGRFVLNTYEVGDGLVPGKYKVAITSTVEIKGKEGDTEDKSVIPEGYANPDRSGIMVELYSKGDRNMEIRIGDEEQKEAKGYAQKR